jgi:hypothetical protein
MTLNTSSQLIRRAFGLSSSAMMVGLVVWCGWSTMRTMSQGLRPREVAGQRISSNLGSAPSFFDALSGLDAHGYWSFGGWQWKVGRTTVPAAKLDEHLWSLAASTSAQIVASEKSDIEILALLERVGSDPQEYEDSLVYRWGNEDNTIQLVVNSPAKRIVSLAFTSAIGPDQFEVWKALRASSPADGVAVEEHLLPLPAGSRQLAARCDDEGELILEIVTLDLNCEHHEFRACCQSAGWRVDCVRAETGSGSYFLCQRNGEEVSAWSASSDGQLQTLILSKLNNGSHFNNSTIQPSGNLR